MRNLIKNKSKIYYLNYKGEVNATDEHGYLTGEKTIEYSKQKVLYTHISGAKGKSQSEVFGTDIEYDKTIVLTKDEFKKTKIDENSVFFIDKAPQYNGTTPLYDYSVKRIGETINEVVIALIRK